MKVVLYYNRFSSKLVANVIEFLKSYGIDYNVTYSKISENELKDYDLIIVLGEDRDVLTVSHFMKNVSVPILGISVSGSNVFLMESSVTEIEMVVEKVSMGEYHVVEVSRIDVSINGQPSESVPCALNEVAIFPTKSATLMEHTLIVDGEFIWRDYSDGVIVATPTGSTAYSLSAGGPILLPTSKTFVIVSVNSLDLTRRPLVVSEQSKIEVKEISSRCDCEVIIDGSKRFKLDEEVHMTRAEKPALFVKLSREPEMTKRMAKKVLLARELMDMPPSAKLILKTLEYEGPLTQKDIIAKTLLPPRTVRHALSLLLNKGLVQKQPLLRDARQDLYYVSMKFRTVSQAIA